jgi:hypothetical protein
MRRNDHDVTDRIRTTDAGAVAAEVIRLFKDLYDGAAAPELERAIGEVAGMYRGEHPDYHACDTGYHDIQHVLDVTLAMARLMDGYERGRAGGAQLGADVFRLGVVAALCHDIGYLRRRSDSRHRNGAEYTLTHVTRSTAFLRSYLGELGLGRLASSAALVHYTGYERAPETLRLADALLVRVGHMLGTADLLAQMADRCYLEKCRDRLYPELSVAGLAANVPSGDHFVRRTPQFYASAAGRLERDLHDAQQYAARHFGGDNLYQEEMLKNVRHAQALADAPGEAALRRQPPSTLASSNPEAAKDQCTGRERKY